MYLKINNVKQLSFFKTSLIIISVTTEFRIQVFLVISMYFKPTNILLEYSKYPQKHPVYLHYIYIWFCNFTTTIHLPVLPVELVVSTLILWI